MDSALFVVLRLMTLNTEPSRVAKKGLSTLGAQEQAAYSGKRLKPQPRKRTLRLALHAIQTLR